MNKEHRSDVPSVAYFSMEYGLTDHLKIYSGGLGVLAGDYIKEASDSNVNMVAIGFLYRFGYFTQTLSVDGQQIANYEPQQFSHLPITQVKDEAGHPVVVEVPYPNRVVYANVWKAQVGRVPLFLLDTDMELNSEFDRQITHQLYGGDWENRIKQMRSASSWLSAFSIRSSISLVAPSPSRTMSFARLCMMSMRAARNSPCSLKLRSS